MIAQSVVLRSDGRHSSAHLTLLAGVLTPGRQPSLDVDKLCQERSATRRAQLREGLMFYLTHAFTAEPKHVGNFSQVLCMVALQAKAPA